jgi:glucose-6-phosphate dehydrogenase assembly protein OpcA
VIPLLLPELPVFLWWPKGAPFDEYIFRQLADSLNRLIVDSATFENPEGMLSKMSSRLKRDWAQVACTDTNWGRLTRWRELIAQFFDGAPLRPYLDRIGEVVIDFAMPRSGNIINRSQAMLLTGWLASRLGWEPRDPVYEVLRAEGSNPAPVRVSLQSGTRPINVLIRSNNTTSDVPGDVCGVKLQVPGSDPDGDAEAIFAVQVEKEENLEHCARISASVQGMSTSERIIQVEPIQTYMLLDADLEVFSHDRVYEEALEMAGLIIRGTTRQEDGPRKIVSGEPVSAIPRHPRPPETHP